VRRYLEGREALFVENNYFGQLAMITRMFAGVGPTAVAVKFNGRPITTDDVVEAYRKFEAGQKTIKLESDL
jgi:2-oxoglutarate ferredoxin oxidoreductase subunit alpha